MTATVVKQPEKPKRNPRWRAECEDCAPSAVFPFYPHWRSFEYNRAGAASTSAKNHNADFHPEGVTV